MIKPLKDVVIRRYDPVGPYAKRKIRLSIYFDDFQDNHHIEFPVEITREEFLRLLVNLHGRIRSSGEPDKF